MKDILYLVNNFLECRTDKCWMLDRKSNKNLVSCASSGLGCYAFAIAAELNLITRDNAVSYIRSCLDNMLEANKGNHGWLRHFSDLQGKPTNGSEISSIDSTIFFLSVERSAERLGDAGLLKKIKEAKENIDLTVMMSPDGLFYHTPERRSVWANYDEGVLIYKFFGRAFSPVHTRFDLPLFCYSYPLVFFEDEIWRRNLEKVVTFQLETTGHLGYSAIDTENGYEVNSPYYISPLAEYVANTVLRKENVKPNRLVHSVRLDGRWVSKDRVLLDDGILLLGLTR